MTVRLPVTRQVILYESDNFCEKNILSILLKIIKSVTTTWVSFSCQSSCVKSGWFSVFAETESSVKCVMLLKRGGFIKWSDGSWSAISHGLPDLVWGEQLKGEVTLPHWECFYVLFWGFFKSKFWFHTSCKLRSHSGESCVSLPSSTHFTLETIFACLLLTQT